MLEKVLCVKGFTRSGEGLAKLGEVERNGFVGCGDGSSGCLAVYP